MAAAAVARLPGVGAATSLTRLLANQGTRLVPDRRGGSINYNAVFSTLNKFYSPAGPKETLAEVDAGERQLGYLDLMSFYANRQSPLMQKYLTAAMLNSAGSVPTQSWAPMLFTNEQNFIMTRMDVVQLPFDHTAPGGIARITNYTKTERKASLEHVKRAVEIEMSLLEDELVGEQMLDMALASVATAAQLTLAMKSISGFVDQAYMEEMKRLDRAGHPFNHARQMLMEQYECFLGNVDPVLFLNNAVKKRTRETPFDTLILAEGDAANLQQAQLEASAPMRAFALEYESSLKEILVGEYTTGMSFGSVPAGDGTRIVITESASYMAMRSDPVEKRFQALRANITLGEFATMRARNPDAPMMDERELDVAMPHHVPTSIIWRNIRYREALAANPMFRNADNTMPPDGGFSDTVNQLVKDYNADTTRRQEFYEFFRGTYGRAEFNDRLPDSYLGRDLSLNDMKAWREFFGFVRWDDANNQVATINLIGDTEPKTLPPDHVHKIAVALATRGAAKLNVGLNAPTQAAGPPVYTDGNILRLIRAYLPGCEVKSAEDVYYQSTNLAAKPKITIPVSDASTGQRDNTGQAYALPANLGVSAVEVFLMPIAGESLEQYKARVTPDAIRHAATAGTLGQAHGLAWAHHLTAVPDVGLDHYLALAYEAQREGHVLTAAESAALASFMETMSQANEKLRATLLKKAADKVAATAPNTDLSVVASVKTVGRNQDEARLNNSAAPSMTVAMHVGHAMGQVDAMDIDVAPMGVLLPDADVDQQNAGLPNESNTYKYNGYSWKMYELYAEEHLSGEPLIRAIYGCILHTPFRLNVCQKLATLGCELVRFMYVKPFARFRTNSALLIKAGPETAVMGAGHFMVLIGVNDKEGYFNLNAEFRCGFVAVNPDNMILLPYAMTNTFYGGRNNQLIGSRDAFLSADFNKAATLALPLPVSETVHDVPIALTAEPPYGAPDSGGSIMPTQKHSAVDLLRVFAGGVEALEQKTLYVSESFWNDADMAMTLQRACAKYFNAQTGTWELQEGTGPLGPIGRNVPDAARVYMGQGRFPDNFRSVEVVM